MAKRLYITDALHQPPISPAVDAAWDNTVGMHRRGLVDVKDGVLETITKAIATNSPAGATDGAVVQAISRPLSGNQTISLAIAGQLLAAENANAANIHMQCVIRVLSNDGTTVRGTLIAASAAALTDEFSATQQNRFIPLGGSVVPTTVNALDDDRIVVELGGRKHESATTSRTITFRTGNPSGGTDLPVNQTQTTDGVAWIEFNDTLVFKSPEKLRATQAIVEAVATADNAKVRTTQFVVEVIAKSVPVVAGFSARIIG